VFAIRVSTLITGELNISAYITTQDTFSFAVRLSTERGVSGIYEQVLVQKSVMFVITYTASLSIIITSGVLSDIGRMVFFTFRLSYGFMAHT
jgi:hypothetical protein